MATKTRIKTANKLLQLKHATILASYLLIVWGFYRLIFKLPDEIEELVIKPLVWLIPVFIIVKKEKLSLEFLGITFKNLFPAAYMSLGLGLAFLLEAILINYLKYGDFNFAANIGKTAFFASLGLSFATAVSEEISFRGYLFNRVWQVLGNELAANLSTSVVWALIHIPIVVFVWKLNFSATILYMFLTTLFGIGSAFVFARTKNVASSILLHVLWEWPIILFR
jgi:hypothetical protein